MYAPFVLLCRNECFKVLHQAFTTPTVRNLEGILYIKKIAVLQTCAWTFARQRKCGALGTVVLSAVLCGFVAVSTILLSTHIYMARCK